MELRALYRELLPRLDSAELNGQPTWLAGLTSGGLTRLPIRFALAA
jgi:cytochrome P450